MNYITITTPDNIEIEYRLAGAGSRLGASVVDFLMQILAIAALVLTIFFTAFQGETSNLDNLDDAGWIVGIALLAIFLIFYGYYIFAEVYMNGQTVGKKIYGLRVIKENGQPINFSQSLIRNILKLTLDFTGVGVIMIMFSKKCKRLGDMAASTIVVALDPNRINLSAVSLAQMLSAEKKDSVSLESEYDTSFLNEYAQKMNGEAAAQNDDATQNEATTQNEAAAQNDDATQNEAAAQNQDASQPGVPVIPEITVEENFALTEKEYRLIKEYFDRRENFLDGGENVFENFGYYFSKKFSKPADYFTDYKLLQMLEKNFR